MNGTVIISLEDYEKMKKQMQNLETSVHRRDKQN